MRKRGGPAEKYSGIREGAMLCSRGRTESGYINACARIVPKAHYFHFVE
jgi:hypothetical protein